MYPKEEYLKRARTVNEEMKEQLNRKSLKFNWHEADVTVLEGVFARGDRRVGQVLLKAYQKGCLFDAWTEAFDNQNASLGISFRSSSVSVGSPSIK